MLFTSFKTNLEIIRWLHEFSLDSQIVYYRIYLLLGAIFILRKDIGVGGWSKKWQFSLTLCSEIVGGWVVQKSLKTPLLNIKMAPYLVIKTEQFFIYIFWEVARFFPRHVIQESNATFFNLRYFLKLYPWMILWAQLPLPYFWMIVHCRPKKL